MNQPTSEVLRRSSERAARAAAPALLDAFRNDMEIWTKRDPGDVVTRFDSAAERTITASLLEDHPDAVVLGEEGGSTGAARLRFIVDPIDGTANFARGLAYWCISIAAELDGVVVAGVVLDAVADHLFAADEHGATVNGASIRSSSYPDEQSTLLTSFPSRHDVDLLGDRAFEFLRETTAGYRHVHNLGSGALNLAHVAAGWSDATMGFDTNAWDIAAGALILERAGGSFVGMRGGVRVARPHDALDYVGAGAGNDHGALLERIRSISETLEGAPA